MNGHGNEICSGQIANFFFFNTEKWKLCIIWNVSLEQCIYSNLMLIIVNFLKSVLNRRYIRFLKLLSRSFFFTIYKMYFWLILIYNVKRKGSGECRDTCPEWLITIGIFIWSSVTTLLSMPKELSCLTFRTWHAPWILLNTIPVRSAPPGRSGKCYWRCSTWPSDPLAPITTEWHVTERSLGPMIMQKDCKISKCNTKWANIADSESWHIRKRIVLYMTLFLRFEVITFFCSPK